MFRIHYARRAVRDLTRLDPPDRKRVVDAIEAKLSEAPHLLGKPLRGSLRGGWSLRVGDWRVIYRIEGGAVIVGRIGHRSEVYDEH